MTIAEGIYLLESCQPEGDSPEGKAMRNILERMQTIRDTGIVAPGSELSKRVGETIERYHATCQNKLFCN